jgi:hypothetical protein
MTATVFTVVAEQMLANDVVTLTAARAFAGPGTTDLVE